MELRGELAKMLTMGASQRTVCDTGVVVVVPAPEISSLNSLISRFAEAEEASWVESDTYVYRVAVLDDAGRQRSEYGAQVKTDWGETR
jgi:hypothetical protein